MTRGGARYPKPDTSDDYRATAQECIDRAQRALEVAEVNLDTIAELFNANKEKVTFTDLIAHATARAGVGNGWRGLAALKNLEGLR
jgi:hypothetical protein